MASPVSIESLERSAHLSIPKNAINGKKPAGLEKGDARLTHVTNCTKLSVKMSHQKEKCAQMKPAHTFILPDGEIRLPSLRLEPMAMVPKSIVKAQAMAMPKVPKLAKSTCMAKPTTMPKEESEMKEVPKVKREHQQPTMERDIRVDAKPREEEVELGNKEERAGSRLEVNTKAEQVTKEEWEEFIEEVVNIRPEERAGSRLEVNIKAEQVTKEERVEFIEEVVNIRPEESITKVELVTREEWVNTKVELVNNTKLGQVNIKVYQVNKVRCMEAPTQCLEMVEQPMQQ